MAVPKKLPGGNYGKAFAAATALVGLLNNPEVKRALSAASTQTKKWATQIRKGMATEDSDGTGARHFLMTKHGAVALLRRLDALAEAATDIAPINGPVADEVSRQERDLRVKVKAARHLPAELRKPKLKALAPLIAALEQQLAAAIG